MEKGGAGKGDEGTAEEPKFNPLSADLDWVCRWYCRAWMWVLGSEMRAGGGRTGDQSREDVRGCPGELTEGRAWAVSAGTVPTRQGQCLGVHTHSCCKLRADTLQRKLCSNFFLWLLEWTVCYLVVFSFREHQTGKDLMLSKPPVWVLPISSVLLHQILSCLCCIILLTGQICQKFTLLLHIFHTHSVLWVWSSSCFVCCFYPCHLKCTILDKTAQEQYFFR